MQLSKELPNVMVDEIKSKKPEVKDALPAVESEENNTVLETDRTLEKAPRTDPAEQAEGLVDFNAFEDQSSQEKSPTNPEEVETTEQIATDVPELVEKEKPIEPPKAGLAPETPRPKYSAQELKENISGIVPGSNLPGGGLQDLRKKAQAEQPLADTKNSISRSGAPHDISSEAAKLHGENNQDAAA